MRHISVIVVSPWRNGDPDQGLMSHSSDVIFPHPQNTGVFFLRLQQQQVAQSAFSNVTVFKLGNSWNVWTWSPSVSPLDLNLSLRNAVSAEMPRAVIFFASFYFSFILRLR